MEEIEQEQAALESGQPSAVATDSPTQGRRPRVAALLGRLRGLRR